MLNYWRFTNHHETTYRGIVRKLTNKYSKIIILWPLYLIICPLSGGTFEIIPWDRKCSILNNKVLDSLMNSEKYICIWIYINNLSIRCNFQSELLNWFCDKWMATLKINNKLGFRISIIQKTKTPNFFVSWLPKIHIRFTMSHTDANILVQIYNQIMGN